MSVARVWALPGLGGMGGLRAEFAAGTETPHPSHRKKQALPAVHPNSKPCRFGRAIQAGRVWTNCFHAYPAHAAFGGYKQSGIGRENHKMMLDHYQQTKNLLVSYSPKKLGFF